MKGKPSIESLSDEIREIRKAVDEVNAILLRQDLKVLDGWISEERAMRLTGLSKSSLYRLRRSGQVRASSLLGKGIFYQADDFKSLLDKNHKLK